MVVVSYKPTPDYIDPMRKDVWSYRFLDPQYRAKKIKADVLENLKNKEYLKSALYMLAHRIQAYIALTYISIAISCCDLPRATLNFLLLGEVAPFKDVAKKFVYQHALNVTYFFAGEILLGEKTPLTDDALYLQFLNQFLEEAKLKIVKDHQNVIKNFFDEENKNETLEKFADAFISCNLSHIGAPLLFEWVTSGKPLPEWLLYSNSEQIIQLRTLINKARSAQLSKQDKELVLECLKKEGETITGVKKKEELQDMVNEFRKPWTGDSYFIKNVHKINNFLFDTTWYSFPKNVPLKYPLLEKRVSLIYSQMDAFNKGHLVKTTSLFVINRIISVIALPLSILSALFHLVRLTYDSLKKNGSESEAVVLDQYSLQKRRVKESFQSILVNIPAIIAPEIGIPIFFNRLTCT